METGTMIYDSGRDEASKGASVDVIIPVYRPDRRFARLLAMLAKQTYPVNRIIVMKTEQNGWNEATGKFRIWRFIT